MAENNRMDFVPMTSIEKKPTLGDDKCSDWVATEKVHGSSFQLYISNGSTVNVGSRRRNLDKDGSFLRCNIKQLLKEYEGSAVKLWHLVHYQSRWASYRESFADESSDEDDADNGDGDEESEKVTNGNVEDSKGSSETKDKNINSTGDFCHIRIYGELYGGGGINKDVKSAVQKEIIYCDDFRFYVFGITVNRKWLTIAELSDLCKEAGFPYYAKPVCEPKATMEELKDYLMDSGFMRTRSALTDKQDDQKTAIEGVVMTPLTRPDVRLHAVKFLAPAFNDVREAQFCKTKTTNYCTKQRYHSVISKLDTHERENTEMVVDMFIADIIKESPDKNPQERLKNIWAKLVRQWLTEDGYVRGGEGKARDNDSKENEKKEDAKEEEEEEGMGMSLFGL